MLGFSGGSKIHKELFRYYGMCNDRIFLMPMMINNTRFYKSKKKKDIIFTFLYVGRLINTKNVDILCEKFIKNFSEKKAQLIVVGDGDLFKKYKTLYASSKVHFKGNIFGEELIDIYHNSSVFILPSTSEQWGLVINEALCSGLPVIARKEVGAIYDLMLNKNTGFIIDNWFELENSMLELYNNPDLIEEYSNNAVTLMKEQWNYKLYEHNLLKAINIY